MFLQALACGVNREAVLQTFEGIRRGPAKKAFYAQEQLMK